MTAQVSDTLNSDRGPAANPIDFITGEKYTGPRLPYKERLAELENTNYKEWMEATNFQDRGLDETGEAAITLVAL